MIVVCFFFCKQKTAYEMRISDWSSDVCSSDLRRWVLRRGPEAVEHAPLRLPLGRGLRLASAAVAGIANRAWIFAHLAHGSRARAKDLHRRAFRPFRQSDLARQSAPVGESTNLRRSEEHTSELQSLMRLSYAVFCLKKKKEDYQQLH